MPPIFNYVSKPQSHWYFFFLFLEVFWSHQNKYFKKIQNCDPLQPCRFFGKIFIKFTQNLWEHDYSDARNIHFYVQQFLHKIYSTNYYDTFENVSSRYYVFHHTQKEYEWNFELYFRGGKYDIFFLKHNVRDFSEKLNYKMYKNFSNQIHYHNEKNR